MNPETAAWIEAEKQRHAHALDLYGDVQVTDIRAALGEPYPPSSAPGEAPHRRTGRLTLGVRHEVVIDGPSIRLTVISERDPTGVDEPYPSGRGTMEIDEGNSPEDVPQKLEFQIDRPYMRPRMDLAESEGVAPIVERLAAI